MSTDLLASVERAKAACRQQNAALIALIAEQLEDITADLFLLDRGRRPELATELRTNAERLAGICEGLARPHVAGRNEMTDELMDLLAELDGRADA